MTKSLWKALCVGLLSLGLLGACAADRQAGPKQSVGAVGGAILGGIAGAQFGKGSGQLIATGIGAVLGGLAGADIGRSLDEVDRMRAHQAVTEATTAPIGKKITWNNPESGNYGTVTPLRDGQADSGEYCREFQQTVTIGGREEEAYGYACRQPDGSWQIYQ